MLKTAANQSATYRKPQITTVSGRQQMVRPVNSQMIARKQPVVVGRAESQPLMRQAVAEKRQPIQQIATEKRQPVQQSARQTSGMQQQPSVMQKVLQKSAQQTVAPKRPTAQELKQAAIKKALNSAAKPQKQEKVPKVHFGFKRVLLALACASAAVFAIVYFVNLNAPNVSPQVAAMQTGIDASYPSYVPRDFSLSDITSESGKVTLVFKNSSTGDMFSLIEEESSWDSNALLNNFVRKEYKEDYTVIREQGLTLYISNSDAAWVNGGVVYKINTTSGTLTKKQIKSIAVSL